MEGPGVATYQGFEFSKASVIAYAEENGVRDISTRIAKEYIRSVMKKRKHLPQCLAKGCSTVGIGNIKQQRQAGQHP